MNERSETIDVRVDDQPRTLPPGTALATLVASLGHTPDAVGTAVNGAFVARDARAACVLQAGDAVMLFRPIVGG
jgi:sulfur carrier protein